MFGLMFVRTAIVLPSSTISINMDLIVTLYVLPSYIFAEPTLLK